ncbi:MAG: amidohydrolase family protein [Bacteroidales bacterium]|nr:amidohydrolase family protein [Bacteroidales bacterium]
MSNTILSSDWIFTNFGAPIKGGGLEIDSKGYILRVLTSNQLTGLANVEFYPGFLVPGFVNAHCHLELSYLAARVNRNTGINDFIARIEEVRNDFDKNHRVEAAQHALYAMQDEGIVAIGDICNSNDTVALKADSTIQFRNFIEVYGLNPLAAQSKMDKALVMKELYSNSSVVPHATYSVSEELLSIIYRNIEKNDVLTIHNQESEAENDYFKSAQGGMKKRFESWHLPLPQFIPSGKSPIETIRPYLPNVKNPFIFVHNTFSTKEDIDFIIENFSNAYFCLCPASNLFIENSLPDFSLFSNLQKRVCIGTDSLASNDNLSVLQELKIISAHVPEIPTYKLIEWSGINGARALGFDSWVGDFKPGKAPGIVWIEDVDVESCKLTEWSLSQILVHAQTK